jgi:hypothetical protein
MVYRHLSKKASELGCSETTAAPQSSRVDYTPAPLKSKEKNGKVLSFAPLLGILPSYGKSRILSVVPTAKTPPDPTAGIGCSQRRQFRLRCPGRGCLPYGGFLIGVSPPTTIHECGPRVTGHELSTTNHQRSTIRHRPESPVSPHLPAFFTALFVPHSTQQPKN